MTLAWVLSNTGWLWRVSRPRPSRYDILFASSSRTLRSWPGDIPGLAPDDILLEAPQTLPGIREEVRRRHQGRQGVLPIYSWRIIHVFVINNLQTTLQQWEHCAAGGEWRKRAEWLPWSPADWAAEVSCCFFWLFWTFSSDRDRKLLACGGESHVSLVTRPSSENHWSRSAAPGAEDWVIKHKQIHLLSL